MPSSLNEWIDGIGRLSVHDMDLGLERVHEVWHRLHPGPISARVVTISGTNGKGTCAHFLDRLLRADGARTGLYTSPHLLHFNERVRLDGEPIDDESLCRAFARVEAVREDVALTFFEFTTLAALCAFSEASVDVVILEVGLGGRLDAVNVVDPDVAIVTRIGLDHTDVLGETVDDIAREKAGIFRRGAPAIICRSDAPSALLEAARSIGARLVLRGIDFELSHLDNAVRWQMGATCMDALPLPGDTPLDSFAGALAAMATLGRHVTRDALDDVLATWQLAGRLQWVDGAPSFLLDVAHNPQAGRVLAHRLAQTGGRVYAVVGMLANKDTDGFVASLGQHVDTWHAVPTAGPRGLTAAALTARLHAAGLTRVAQSASLADGLACARARSAPDDVVLVCGSFQVVGPALAWLGIYCSTV